MAWSKKFFVSFVKKGFSQESLKDRHQFYFIELVRDVNQETKESDGAQQGAASEKNV